MHLAMKDLKDELKKRGHAMSGKKTELQNCLKEAFLLDVLVALGNEDPHCKCIVGLDVMVS